VSETALTIGLPDEALRRIAERIVELIGTRSPEEEWIGVEAAARHLGCKPARIYYLVGEDRIPHRKEGRRLKFRRSQLDAWLDSGEAAEIDD
jgi:excisionase family DNA binding protein